MFIDLRIQTWLDRYSGQGLLDFQFKPVRCNYGMQISRQGRMVVAFYDSRPPAS